jgi:hypothetical protein
LELGTFLEWDRARNFAIQALSRSDMQLSPACRLSLAISYRINDWIEPSFRELLATPTDKITLEDYMHLGYEILHVLISTKAKIHNHRLLVAYNPLNPPAHDASCKSPRVTCQSNWEEAWWDGLARLYLHPESPPSPEEIIMVLENTPVGGVTPACRRLVVELIKERRVFERENDMKEEALKRIRELEGTILGMRYP